MHRYATDYTSRQIEPFVMAVLSILLTYGASYLTRLLSLSIPWWIAPPSTLSLYGLLTFLYRRYVWKARLFKQIPLSSIPNLSGHWKGQIISDFDRKETAAHAVIDV